MKKLMIASCIALAAAVSVQAQTTPPTPQQQEQAAGDMPKFQFSGSETFDFGTLKQGPEAVHVFEFKNAGKQPLIIQEVTASCGCTTPMWPKEPILPGKKGKITVKYATQGRPGPFMKDVYIRSNASKGNDRYILHIKGTVEQDASANPGAQPNQ